ncbi:nicotianamine synthase [Carica papaya]|uniref:nicotianamine synthase n=1 Tax=Carica papaya TaxID=3649 RepID=UPI000B8C94AB|nr:nicotianamine synthase [Carica papaya]
MGCGDEALVQKICELYEQISSLDSLKPSKHVNTLFTQLVHACIPPTPIDVNTLSSTLQETRFKLIKLCAQAETLLESHFSSILASFDDNPLHHLTIFPYYSNYLKLGHLEFNILNQHVLHAPTRVAFVGSGPLPLTSIVLASFHLAKASFHNYDIDPSANSMAQRLVSPDPDLSSRMFFHTCDIMDVTTELKDYDVVFLAALVGMDKEEKVRVIDHLAKFMAPGSILMLRSAHGARAFLYPIVETCDLRGFEALSVHHPTDEVINSVVVARKLPMSKHPLDQDLGHRILPNKCSEIQSFNPLITHGSMIEELTFEEQLS